jgi:hypothetical protein
VDVLRVPCPVPGDLDRHEQALGAARRGEAGRVVATVQQTGDGTEQLPLHPADAGEGLGVEPVLVQEHGEGPLGQGVHLGAWVVDEGEHPAVPPGHVTLLHAAELSDELIG